jgi:arylsulfatase A-like enzyme
MATAAELAGVEPPPHLDSISFAPTLLGEPERQKQHEYLYWEFHERGFTQAVRMGDWKAVRLGTKKPVELYDLKTDIGEEHDVAAQHPEIIAKMEAILKSAHTDSTYFPIREGGPKKPGAPKKPATNQP